MTAQVAPHACLRCGHVADRVTDLANEFSPEKPTEGSVSLCIRCGSTGIFTDEGTLRHPTEVEWWSLWLMPEYRRASAALEKLLRAETSP